MIPRDCKRLAEVNFPIAEVSRQAVREKSIRRGHPSTLHLWWARRPLASSRAILTALLLPDPCDAQCPKTFKEEARHILLSMYGRLPGETSTIERDEGLRRMMLKFIADFANWDNAAKPKYLKTGQALEIFSRYSGVETADGREVGLSEYLKVFREAAGREALRHGGDA